MGNRSLNLGRTYESEHRQEEEKALQKDGEPLQARMVDDQLKAGTGIIEIVTAWQRD